MHNLWNPVVLSGLLVAQAVARDVPANVQSLFDSITSQGSCSNELATGFYSREGDSKGAHTCFTAHVHTPIAN